MDESLGRTGRRASISAGYGTQKPPGRQVWQRARGEEHVSVLAEMRGNMLGVNLGKKLGAELGSVLRTYLVAGPAVLGSVFGGILGIPLGSRDCSILGSQHATLLGEFQQSSHPSSLDVLTQRNCPELYPFLLVIESRDRPLVRKIRAWETCPNKSFSRSCRINFNVHDEALDDGITSPSTITSLTVAIRVRARRMRVLGADQPARRIQMQHCGSTSGH